MKGKERKSECVISDTYRNSFKDNFKKEIMEQPNKILAKQIMLIGVNKCMW